MVGKEIEIFETNDGFNVRFTDEKFKQSRHSEIELGSPDIEGRVSDLELKIKQISSILANKESFQPCPQIPRNTERKPHESTLLYRSGSNLVSQNTSRARGLVGYDVALTPLNCQNNDSASLSQITLQYTLDELDYYIETRIQGLAKKSQYWDLGESPLILV